MYNYWCEQHWHSFYLKLKIVQTVDLYDRDNSYNSILHKVNSAIQKYTGQILQMTKNSVHCVSPYNLKIVFDRPLSNVSYKAYHFVNHHSLVRMVQIGAEIRHDHIYLVDGIFLSLLLKVLGVSHTYLPGPVFFQSRKR